MDDAYDLMRRAIIERAQVVCDYRGYTREVCPHVIGRKNGQGQVLCYQFGGGSNSGLPPEGQWRCMVVSGISNARLRSGEWYTGNSHTRPQTCVDDVDVEVRY
jgi:hypothetical protein